MNIVGNILELATRVDYRVLFLFSLLPFLALFVVLLWQKEHYSFPFFFTASYLLSGLSKYLGYSTGIAMDALIALLFIAVAPQLLRRDRGYSINDLFHPITVLTLLWLLYALFQAINPNLSSITAWIINVRGIAVYPFITVLLASFYMRNIERVEKILKLWSFLTIIAVVKAMGQRMIGFDPFELRWLAEGGATTHIIQYGVRYFSIFTDAGNFGSGIAISGVVFTIYAFNFKEWSKRLYYLVVALLAFYGMVISGTRGSLVVPLTSFALLMILAKNSRVTTISFAGLVGLLFFLNFTYIGHSNSYIRRMRSAFNFEDQSLQVRVENHKLIREYLKGYPFGYGLGMKRGNAVLYTPDPILSQIAHDSWYMLLWAELGLVGMVYYIVLLLSILFYGSYLILFALKEQRVRLIVTASVCALFGVSFAAYSLEIFGQLPNSIVIFTLMSVISLSPRLERRLLEERGGVV